MSLASEARKEKAREAKETRMWADWVEKTQKEISKEAAERACKEPNPIIDGRKANVNLAILGAKPRGNLTGNQCQFIFPRRRCCPTSRDVRCMSGNLHRKN